MALYSYQSINVTTGAITLSTPTTSDTVQPDDRGFLYFENTNAATRTVTIAALSQFDFGPSTMPDFTWTLGATTGRLWIPCLQQFANPDTGLITVALSAVLNVTSAAIRR